MELYQIRYFLNLAETLNFTRASERSFVSQPALTKAIQRLEDTVGGRLFDRTKSSVQLTDLGQAMLPTFQQLFNGAQQAKEQARRLTTVQHTVVQVGLMCTVDMEYLLPGFAKNQNQTDQAELAFTDGSLELIIDKLDQGEVDLAIMSAPYDIPKRFKSAVLFSEPFVIAFGDAHRFLGRSSVDVQELDKESYCSRIECELRAPIQEMLDDRNIALNTVYQSAREDWVQAFVRSNFGVAFMPLSTARRARMNFTHVADDPISRVVSVYWHSDRPLNPIKRSIIDMLVAHPWPPAIG